MLPRVNSPTDPALARLWRAALAKFAARAGHEAATPAEYREVVNDYAAMMQKQHGSLGAVVTRLIQERCAETKTPGD
jgi:hypothetical protein